MPITDLSKTFQFQLLAPFNLQLENREGKWNEAIATLNSKAPFTITSDIKSLLRLGIPISQRVSFDLVITKKFGIYSLRICNKTIKIPVLPIYNFL